jgi:hypothetical protein
MEVRDNLNWVWSYLWRQIFKTTSLNDISEAEGKGKEKRPKIYRKNKNPDR